MALLGFSGTCTGLLLLVLPVSEPSAPSTVAQGDLEFGRIQYPTAEAFYDSALATAADSAGVLWRLARVCVCRADVSEEDQQLNLYRQAEAFAVRCIAADSLKSEGHTWRAAALGNIAMFEGGKTKVSLCRTIEKELACSIALNPGDDIAYSILGSFYMALGNVSWIERRLAAVFLGSLPEGGYAESERSLKKAIALSPGVIRHHFVLGELYMHEDRPTEALGEMQRVVTLPVLLASDRGTQLRAAGLIKSLEPEAGEEQAK
jgi:tetratricopeptide (TPR) repeat protein